MIRLLGNTTNPYLTMLVFFLVPFILTQVMSNLATLTIFIPWVAPPSIRGGAVRPGVPAVLAPQAVGGFSPRCPLSPPGRDSS